MTQVTGIPIEYLFAAIGTLGTAVYADMKREMRALRKAGEKRDEAAAKRDIILTKLTTAFSFVCHKLGIPFNGDHPNDPPP